jgi:hypothetical protein
MTGAQWLKGADPQRLLESLGERASDRKLRLFSCACCRRAWHLARTARFQQALPLVEGFADGTTKDRDRGRAHGISGEVLQDQSLPVEEQCLGGELWAASRKTLKRDGYEFYGLGESAAAAIGYAAGTPHPRWAAAKKAERKEQAKLLRDIFGNPFQPVAFSPEWRTDTTVALARQMYESREFSAMPILADALQDAGCDNANILGHCRGNGPHVRGCWVADMVLDKR